MPKYSFSEGTKVYYQDMLGVIRFVGNEYVTVCIKTSPTERVRDVCLVVYQYNFKDIIIVEE